MTPHHAIRVAAGKVKVYVHFFFLNGKAVRYSDKDRPVIPVEVADGESKSDLDFSVSPPAGGLAK